MIFVGLCVCVLVVIAQSLAKCGVQIIPAGALFLASCCEVAARLSIRIKNPRIPSGKEMSWYPSVWLLEDNEVELQIQ